MMDNFLNPINRIVCNIIGPPACGKSCFLTNIILNFVKGYRKVYIYSPSLYRDLYQRILKRFSNFKQISMIQKNPEDGRLDFLIVETINDKNFEYSETEKGTNESIEELKFPQDFDLDFPIVKISDDLNGNEIYDLRIQARFKRSRHSNISVFIISQDYYELPKKRFGPAGTNIIHSNQREFENCSKFLSNQVIHGHDTSWIQSSTVNLLERERSTTHYWNEKDKKTGRFRLRLNYLFVPDSSPF